MQHFLLHCQIVEQYFCSKYWSNPMFWLINFQLAGKNWINSNHTSCVWLICLMILVLFQEPAAKLLDWPCAIIHWEAYFHAIPVRVWFQVIYSSTSVCWSFLLDIFSPCYFFRLWKKDLINQFAIWAPSKGNWESHGSSIIVRDLLACLLILNNWLVSEVN